MIAVIGGEQAPPAACDAAEEVGRLLARSGCTIICGGRGGIMEAVCRGARAAGGHTIGIIPGNDRSGVNPYVEFPIVSGIGFARNSMVVLSADAVIAINGSFGTLSEIAYALNYGKPVVGLDTWEVKPTGGEEVNIIRAAGAAEAVEIALALAAGRDEEEQHAD